MYIEIILSLFIGGVITYAVARYYYERAAKELKVESEKLRDLLRIVLQSMEDAKMVTLNRAEDGSITGMTHHISGGATVKFDASAKLGAVKPSLETDELR